MTLNAQKTTFIISRIKNGTEEVAQYNDYNGSIYWYSNRDSATDFEDLELAIGIKQIQDSFAKITKQDVTFKLYQMDAETFEINEAGERVVVEETPVEDETVETA